MSFAPVTLAARAPDAGLLLTCEHASPAVPPEYHDLGLAAAQLRDHIGWDIGAAIVTEELGRQFGAPAVLSAASRLLVDCNRDLADADLIPAASCGVSIPGNLAVDDDERAERLARFYQPYHQAIDVQARRHPRAVLLSVHTFTPELHGRPRPFDVGVLFDEHSDLARTLAAGVSAAGFSVRLNEPYSGFDGLIFSARSHGRRHARRYVELEINNRLLRRDADARAVARRLVEAVAALIAAPAAD